MRHFNLLFVLLILSVCGGIGIDKPASKTSEKEVNIDHPFLGGTQTGNPPTALTIAVKEV